MRWPSMVQDSLTVAEAGLIFSSLAIWVSELRPIGSAHHLFTRSRTTFVLPEDLYIIFDFDIPQYPGEAALDDPSSWPKYEAAFGRGMLDHFELDAVLGRSLGYRLFLFKTPMPESPRIYAGSVCMFLQTTTAPST